MEEIIEPLHSRHRKSDFFSGNIILDRYFHMQAGQDIKKQVCTCFVLTGAEQQVKGYYTLSSAALHREAIPLELQKKMPSYKAIPVTLLGRLAIDKHFQKKGLGEFLLIDALKRSYENSKTAIGSVAVIVDPIDDAAVKFYERYGFIPLPDSGKMVLPMKTIAALF